MSTTRPRVLLIGCGNIAGRFDMARPADAWPVTQAGAFRRHGGYELAACIEQREVFLVGLHREDEALLWHVEELFFKLAHQHVGAFD